MAFTAGKVPVATDGTHLADSHFSDSSISGLAVELADSGVGAFSDFGLGVRAPSGDIGIVAEPDSAATSANGFSEWGAVGTSCALLQSTHCGGAYKSAPTATVSGRRLYEQDFYGYGATDYQLAVEIKAFAEGTFTDTHYPASYWISTQNAADDFARRFGVDGDGNVNVQNGYLIVPTHTPSAANDTGKVGTITWDSDFLYVCVATDTWKRIAIATWP